MNQKIRPLTDEEQTLFNILIDRCGLLVNASDAEELLNESKATLYRKRKTGLGPKFLQDTKNSTIRYPLHEIVHYICSDGDKKINSESCRKQEKLTQSHHTNKESKKSSLENNIFNGERKSNA